MESLPKKHASVNGAGRPEKAPSRQHIPKKAPSRQAEKAPSRPPRKAPSYYSPVVLSGVIGVMELRERLVSYGQVEWLLVRAYGLLVLLHWVCRNVGSKPLSISAQLARQYVSPIKRRKHSDTILDPLPLLCHIGILEKAAKAVHWHVKTSAKYRLGPEFAGKVHLFTERLPPKIAHKLATAEPRKEERLNRQYAFRAQLLADLDRLGFAQEARAIIAGMHRAKRGGGGLPNIIAAIDGKAHSVKVDERGTIGTTISSLPRELKPHLTIDGEATVNCDISHAHHCFLPRLLSDRIEYIRREHADGDARALIDAMQAEHQRLLLKLNGRDYYREWCKDPEDDDERKAKKGFLNAMLNMANGKIVGNRFYESMRRKFPHTFGILENIKREDHRNASKQLQRFTSDAIKGALLELQNEGIAAIPQVDAIICRECDQERVREIIGKHFFRESRGVCCKVNGIPTAGFANLEKPPRKSQSSGKLTPLI
jgi:hypothetical protein